MPKRIQLSRTKGYRKPKDAIVVSRPTKWGNPFRAVKVHPAAVTLRQDAQAAVDAFRRYVEGGLGSITVADVRSELRGKDLACWCYLGEPCHADVLLEIANRG